MKKSQILFDLIGEVDEKYVEYGRTQAKEQRAKTNPRMVIIAAVVAILTVSTAIILPLSLRSPKPTPPDTTPSDTASSDLPSIANSGIKIEKIEKIDDDFGLIVGEMISPATEMALDKPATLSSFLNTDSSSMLVFNGHLIDTESYHITSKIRIHGNDIVEYDVKTGTTKMLGCEDAYEEVVEQHTLFTIGTYKIDSILKENNSSGYNVGDTVYILIKKWSICNETSVAEMSPEADITQGVFLISTNPQKSYLGAEILNSGLINDDVWALTAVLTEDEFEALK